MLAALLCLAISPVARADWIAFESLVPLLEHPSPERNLQAARLHARYRSLVQALGPARDGRVGVPWDRRPDRPPDGRERLRELLVAEAAFIDALLASSLITEDGAGSLRLDGIVARLGEDPLAVDLLAGGLPSTVDRIVARMTGEESSRLAGRYRQIARSQVDRFGRLETQLNAAILAWYRQTRALEQFTIEPGDIVHPNRRPTLVAWHRALVDADVYAAGDRIRRALADEARRFARSPRRVERAVAAQILLSLAELGTDPRLVWIGRAASTAETFAGAEAADVYIDAVTAAIPDDAVLVRMIPGTASSRPSDQPPPPGQGNALRLELGEIAIRHLASLQHLRLPEEPEPRAPMGTASLPAWPRIGPATSFLAPASPAMTLARLEAFGLPVDGAASDAGGVAGMAEWTAGRRAAARQAASEADDHRLGHVQRPAGMSFSRPEEVERCGQWLDAARARTVALDEQFIEAAMTMVDEHAAAQVGSLMRRDLTIDLGRRSGLLERRPDELRLDFVGWLIERGVALPSIAGELDGLAERWARFAAAERDHWDAVQIAAATHRLPNPVAPDRDAVPDRAASQAELRRAFAALHQRRRETRLRAAEQADAALAAQRELVTFQRRLVASLEDAGVIDVEQYDRASFPELHARFTALLAETRAEARRGGFDDELLVSLILEPASEALTMELAGRKAAALDGQPRPGRLPRVFADLEAVIRCLAE